MRPRRVRRGNRAERGHPVPRHRGFNEAPACPPGKWDSFVRWVCCVTSRFNEAPACPPGKSAFGLRLHGAARGASMRPRRVRRGNPCAPFIPCRGTERFNEAPACPPGKSDTTDLPLPLLVSASMRPRRVRRGNDAGGRGRARRAERFNEAPACPPGKSPRTPPPSPRSTRCFNEAPACPPGKSAPPHGRRDPGLVASMRPRRVRRGNILRKPFIVDNKMPLQ